MICWKNTWSSFRWNYKKNFWEKSRWNSWTSLKNNILKVWTNLERILQGTSEEIPGETLGVMKFKRISGVKLRSLIDSALIFRIERNYRAECQKHFIGGIAKRPPLGKIKISSGGVPRYDVDKSHENSYDFSTTKLRQHYWLNVYGQLRIILHKFVLYVKTTIHN